MNLKICPTCHAPIPADAPGGFCPSCLLREVEEPSPAGHAAPSLEEIAAAFPQWEIIRLTGQGGMGFVYQARQPSLDRSVALKILAPELSRDPAFAERFAREARTLGKLHHPNIVTVFEHGESGGFFYLLMEFVDGVNLRQAMRAGRFTPEQALALVPPICDALQAAHTQGVWHRDIKPENILLDSKGAVKIADFGIARIVGDPHRDFTLTMTGGALGSAAYMAPEQYEKPHDVDHRADIYSLGVVIYEMLTGELPLGRFPAPSQRAAVNTRIDEIVFRTLEKERELRQQSAAEVKTEVEATALGVSTPAIAHDHCMITENMSGLGYSRLSLGLLIGGQFGGLVLLAGGNLGLALLFGGICLLLAMILATMSWRDRLAKVVLVTGSLLMLAYAFEVVGIVKQQFALARAMTRSRNTYADRGRAPDRAEQQGEMRSKLTTGGGYFAFNVHIDGKPIIIVITNSLVRLGIGNSPESQFNWKDLHVLDDNRATIGQETFDLTRGRVFFHQSDGFFRQISTQPDRIPSGVALKEFVESLPAE